MRFAQTFALVAALAATSTAALAQTAPIVLRQGTQVSLKNRVELNTEHAKPGDCFEFELADHLRVNGIVVVPAGATGIGQVTRIVKKGSFGRSGKIDTRLLYIDYRGLHIDLDGQANDRGVGGTIGTIAAIAAGGVIAGAFVHGTSGKVEAESPMTAYVRWDTPVSPVGTPAPVVGYSLVPQLQAQARQLPAATPPSEKLPEPGFSPATGAAVEKTSI